ncbi:MarR family transcriptional regulator [Acidaminobacter sp. JC074]|uniref:MarR family winged helix-turn-helix transcriptional regulator n=1 Tax=Acidaminobacter sp. JC074 TaxID=2530199 RepID=UPI001F10B87D|nr:MarR family transcriptional regulator [Acidaminobacter sp. JC074]MCH4890847.1 MarR family transcriptional regulator [Acidaminobacter sp. JC074]
MEINNCINFLLSASQNIVNKYFAGELSKYGVTPAQYGVLSCLWSHGEMNPSKIRSILKLEASSVSGVLDRMQKEDLIDRKIDPNNRRTIIVSPTEKAMSLKEGIESVVEDMNHKYLHSYSEDEQEVLKKVLQSIIDSNEKK